MERATARKSETQAVERPPGIFRTTLSYNEELMLCHFLLKKGVRVPLHQHEAVQNGYLIRGRLKMLWQSGKQFIAEPGSSWCFASNEIHGAEALEECEAVECFAPLRQDYLPK